MAKNGETGKVGSLERRWRTTPANSALAFFRQLRGARKRVHVPRLPPEPKRCARRRSNSSSKLNSLERTLPQGLVVDSTWLTEHGYSTSLRGQYVSTGWLEQPVKRVYRRPLGPLTWQHVVTSLQTLLGRDLVVGGRTALDLQGYAHYLAQSAPEVHL